MKQPKTKDKVTEYLLNRITTLEAHFNTIACKNAELEKAIRENPSKELAIVEMQEREIVFNTIAGVEAVILEVAEQFPEAASGLEEVIAAIHQRFDI